MLTERNRDRRKSEVPYRRLKVAVQQEHIRHLAHRVPCQKAGQRRLLQLLQRGNTHAVHKFAVNECQDSLDDHLPDFLPVLKELLPTGERYLQPRFKPVNDEVVKVLASQPEQQDEVVPQCDIVTEQHCRLTQLHCSQYDALLVQVVRRGEERRRELLARQPTALLILALLGIHESLKEYKEEQRELHEKARGKVSRYVDKRQRRQPPYQRKIVLLQRKHRVVKP